MHLVFHTCNLQCLKGRDPRLQKVPRLYRNEKQIQQPADTFPTVVLWQATEYQSSKVSKRRCSWRANWLLLGCHVQQVPPLERELSGPLFHSTTIRDCDIVFVLQAWYSAQLLHPKLILWHSGLSTHLSLPCCNTVSQVPSLLFSSTHFIASLLHGTATHLVGEKLINIL